MALVDINRLRTDRDHRLTTGAGISDIAVLSDDFIFRSKIGKVFAFIEVKATNKPLHETEQVIGQIQAATHYLYTNGLVWKYYKDQEFQWEIILASYDNQACSVLNKAKCIFIDPDRYKKLVAEVKKIKWIELTSII